MRWNKKKESLFLLLDLISQRTNTLFCVHWVSVLDVNKKQIKELFCDSCLMITYNQQSASLTFNCLLPSVSLPDCQSAFYFLYQCIQKVLFWSIWLRFCLYCGEMQQQHLVYIDPCGAGFECQASLEGPLGLSLESSPQTWGVGDQWHSSRFMSVYRTVNSAIKPFRIENKTYCNTLCIVVWQINPQLKRK